MIFLRVLVAAIKVSYDLKTNTATSSQTKSILQKNSWSRVKSFDGMDYVTKWQNGQGMVIYAVRGTVDKKDIKLDSKMVYSKFKKTVDGVFKPHDTKTRDSLNNLDIVLALLDDIVNELRNRKRVFITGHSLGGSIALSVNSILKKYSDDLSMVTCVAFAPYIQDTSLVAENACLFGVSSDVVARGVVKNQGVNLLELPKGLGSLSCKGFFGTHGMDCILAALNEKRINTIVGGTTFCVHSSNKKLV